MVRASETPATRLPELAVGATLNWLSLRVDRPEIEAAFWDEDRQDARVQSWAAMALSTFLYAAFAWLDVGLFPDAYRELWFIRFALALPVLLTSLTLYAFSARRQWMNTWLFVALTAGGLGLVAMTAILPPAGASLYYAGLMLMVVVGHVLLRLPFLLAVSATLVVVSAWELVSLFIAPLPRELFINNNFFMLSISTLAAFGGYVYERERRRNFLHRLIIERDKRELADLNAELESIAITDPLTGLLNRRLLGERLDELLARQRRHGVSSSVLMLDLDGFKRVNDELGHEVGDRLLVRVAEILRSELRAGDVAFRLGGDEFCVVLPDTSVADAGRLGERLLATLTTMKGAELPADIRVGFSGGCVMTSDELSSPDELLGAADELLYDAKRSGKGKVVWR